VQQFFPVGNIHHPGIADELGHAGNEQSLARAGRRDDELAPHPPLVGLADRPEGFLLVRELREPL
jgi:hypothetical protein